MIQTINMYMSIVDEVRPWLFPILMIALGGVFGSFITCMIYRVPRKMKLSHPPSSCPRCESVLKVPDLIPIVSYVVNKGKCSSCGLGVPLKYLIIELLCVMTSIALWFRLGPQVMLLFAFILSMLVWFHVFLFIYEKAFAPKVLLFSFMLMGLLLLFSDKLLS